MSTIVRLVTIMILAIVLVAAQIPTLTISSNAVNDIYVDCGPYSFNQNLTLVTTASGLFRKTDVGWNEVLTPTTWSQIQVTPRNLLYLYDPNLFTAYGSSNLGASWTLTATFPPTNATSAFYPTDITNTMFMALDDDLLVGEGPHGLYTSSDGGATWTDHSGGHGTRLFLSPEFAADGTAFTSGWIYHDNLGVLRTKDWGETWEYVNNGLAWGFTFDYLDTYLVVVSPDFATDRTVFASNGTGFYKSVNAGDSWTKIQPFAAYVFALSPNYAADQTILTTGSSSLTLSRDGGATWRSISLPSNTTAQVTALRVIAPFEPPSPTPPPVMPYHFCLPFINVARIQPLETWLIANDGIGCKLYRSPDFGKTWQAEIIVGTKR